ncbi:hypothetical protein SUGI_0577230 [Cryptomeria japonica]|nr:hypothetical protein SUGI_0577230 [Cryptomeria japonica]
METVIIFDFDQTLIDCNSDPWVVNQLGAAELMNSLLRTNLPWTSLMDRMMEELHAKGKNVSDIQNSLKTVPLHPEMIRAIKSAHSLGCDLRIVSDANLFFIKTVLEHYDLLQFFTEIITNPAKIDEEGRLKIFPFHSDSAVPHGCQLCPANMCKGTIVDGIKNCFPPESKKRFIYLGDGRGDFCPSLKLGSEDHVLPRKGYPLCNLLHVNSNLVKAQVHIWSDAKDVEDCLG